MLEGTSAAMEIAILTRMKELAEGSVGSLYYDADTAFHVNRWRVWDRCEVQFMT
jgi:hypothetical protein